jgi:hypothetical protein
MKAFPNNRSEGMTLRDYFAAKAMQGMMSDHTRDNSAKEIADYAYQVADAIMKARDGDTGK